jgi:hypothetical protein
MLGIKHQEEEAQEEEAVWLAGNDIFGAAMALLRMLCRGNDKILLF